MKEQIYNDLISQAVLMIQKGNFKKAIKELTKAIKLNPKGIYGFTFRGMAYSQLGQYDQGIKDYSKVIELNPNDSSNYYQRGHIYFLLEQHEKSIIDFTKAISLNPNNYFAYMERGLIYSEINQNDKAKKDFEKVISLNPDDITLSGAKDMLNKLSIINEVKPPIVKLEDLCLSCRKLSTEDGTSVEDFLTALNNDPIKWLECGHIGIILKLNNAIVMNDDGCTTCGTKIINYAKAFGLVR